MKTFRSALRLVAIVLVFAGNLAATRVNLTVTNPTPYDQDVQVIVSDKDGKPSSPIYMGTIKSQKEGTSSFRVDSRGFFTVQGIYKSVTVSEEKRSVTESSLRPVAQRVELKLVVDELNDKRAEEVLASKFSQMGPERGFLPVPLSEALKTYYGALAVVLPPEKGKSNGSIQVIVSPARFSNPVPESRFVYHSNVDKKTQSVVISGKSGASLVLPLIGNFNMEGGSDSVYKLSYRLEGYGWVPKQESPEWDLAKAVSSLTPEQVSLITSLFKKNPGAQLIYINKIYAVKHAEFYLEKGQKLTTGGSVGVNCIISVHGVYSFEKSETDKKDFHFFALNVEGVPVYLTDKSGAQTQTGSPAAFLAAAGKGKADEVKAMLEKDKSLANVKGENGKTALHLAAEKNRIDLIQLLAAAGADMNAQDKNGETPLHAAAGKGAKEAILLLITRGSDLNARDNQGRTPLARAAAMDNKEIGILLLTGGADPNIKDNKGNTPLLAVSNLDLAKAMIEKGADVNARNTLGQTALHLTRDPALTKLLLAKGANPKARDEMGRTPLHYAGCKESAGLLADKGAELEAKDKQGKTPLALAFDQGRVEVFEYLKNKGASSGEDKAPPPARDPKPEGPKPKDPKPIGPKPGDPSGPPADSSKDKDKTKDKAEKDEDKDAAGPSDKAGEAKGPQADKSDTGLGAGSRPGAGPGPQNPGNSPQ